MDFAYEFSNSRCWSHCSATIKAFHADTTQRSRDLKQLCKDKERELRRLKRQVSTYEILAKTKGPEQDSLVALEETVTVGTGSETFPVNKETIKALWTRDQQTCLRVQELESEVVVLSQHVQVWRIYRCFSSPAAARLDASGWCRIWSLNWKAVLVTNQPWLQPLSRHRRWV